MDPDFSNKLSNLRLSLSHKTNFATQLVSKCNTPGHREDIVKKLKEEIDIDVFGRCGLKPLPKSEKDDKHLNVYRKLLRTYYFYLSFENTRCKDYISEKFYNVLATKSAIPIVYGAKKHEYEIVAPPHSFIHIDDFKSTEDLADYLYYLTENTTAYMEYFWWTTYYSVKRTEKICSVCDTFYDMRSGKIETNRIDDFNKYWVQNSDCNNPKTFPTWMKDQRQKTVI